MNRARSSARALWLAWGTALTSAGLATAALALLIVNHETGEAVPLELAGIVALYALFEVVACLIVRHGSVVVGFGFCVLGLALAFCAFSGEYAAYALEADGARGGELSAWINAWSPGLIATAFVWIVLAIPEGRLPSGHARPLGPLALLVCATMTLVLALVPGRLERFPSLANPYAVEALGDLRSVAVAGLALAVAAALVLSAALLARPRRPALDDAARDAPEGRPADQESDVLPTLPDAVRGSIFRRFAQRRRQRKETSPWRFFRDARSIKPYLRPYWKLASVSVSMIALTSFVALLSPWPLAILIDAVLGNKPLPSLLGPLGGLDRGTLLIIAVTSGLLITAVEHGLSVIDQYVAVKLEQKMVLDFRSDLFRHAQSLSIAFHDKAQTGGLMFQLNSQASSMGAIAVSIPQLAQGLLTLVGMFAVAFKIDAQLALLALTVVPFVYYSAGFYARRIEPRLFHVRGLEGQSLVLVHEAISMMRVIVSFGREKYEHKRFRDQGETAVNARINVTVRQTLFSLVVSVITAAGTALVLGFGAYHVLQKQLTPGELLVIMGYIAAIYMPLEQISVTMSTLQEQFISLRSALDLAEQQPEVQEAPNAISLGRVRGTIEFDNVDFRYPGRSHTLQGISFVAEAGQRTAIVGPTGAGKTTLISLIPRFYDVRDGRITLDGTDVRDIALDSLRAQISIVLQEPLLFSGSIRENIRYGRLEATDEEVEEAAQAANAHTFISQLPEGYDTELGERGTHVSVGERQRISIARAFLKDAPILILDEPTAAIDSRTEAIILDALQRLMGGRTTIMIAHRLSTVRNADLILAINEGRLVEQGSHEELLAGDGLYRQLYEAQLMRPSEPTLHPVPDLDEDVEMPDYFAVEE